MKTPLYHFFPMLAACLSLVSFVPFVQADDSSDNATQVKLLYTGEAWDNTAGGLKRSDLMIHNFDVNVAVDADKKWGWNGASFMLDGFYNNGRSPAKSLTGAAQQASPIDNNGVNNQWRLYQAWYSQDLFDGKTNVLTGLYDLNSDFDQLDSAAMFFNSGFGWNSVLDQSGSTLGPSTYPNTSLALRVRQYLDMKDGVSIQAAVLDGVPDNPKHPGDNAVILDRKNGALLVTEADYHPGNQTKIVLGGWHYTAKYDDQLVTDAAGNPRGDTDNIGAYAGVHQRLYSLTEKRGLDGFANAGWGNGNINRFDRTFATGLMFVGLLDSRPEDELGVAWNIAHNSYPYRQAQAIAGTPVQNSEQVYEISYRAKITDNVTLQPDAQYVVNPDTDPALKNDLIIGMHIEIGYGFGW
jgi:porin